MLRGARRDGVVARIAAAQPHRETDGAVELAGVEVPDAEVPGERARDRPLAARGGAVDGDQGEVRHGEAA